MSETQGDVRFQEVQAPRQWWILLVVALVSALAWYAWIEQAILGHEFGEKPAPTWMIWLIWLLTGIGLPAVLFVGRMIVTVDDRRVLIRWIPFAKREIRLDEIRSANAVTYRPIRDYLGWGVKWMPGRGIAYNVSGNRGVEVVLENGKKVLIGSGKPEALAAAIGRES